MKNLIYIGLIVGIILQSCDKDNDFSNRDYCNIDEIELQTNYARGLAYDGDYLWYSDDSLNTLNKISSNGVILETIELNNCNVTDFEFYNSYIWCINDSTVLMDTTISAFPFSCIYKYSKVGERLDSILIQASVNPQRPSKPS